MKKKLRHYGAYSNCGHEETNNGIKYCASKVTPRHKIENSLQILVNGSERTMLEKSRNVVMASRKMKTRYSGIVYQSLVTYAAAKLADLVDSSSKWQSVKFNQTQYYVTRKEERVAANQQVHPRYHRVRTVTIYQNRLTCDCSFSPVNGIPCVHVLHVEFLDDEYKGPLKRDISVFWWKDYMTFGIDVQNRDFNEREINHNFLKIRLCEKDGLICYSKRYKLLPVTGKEDIPKIFAKYMPTTSVTDAGGN